MGTMMGAAGQIISQLSVFFVLPQRCWQLFMLCKRQALFSRDGLSRSSEQGNIDPLWSLRRDVLMSRWDCPIMAAGDQSRSFRSFTAIIHLRAAPSAKPPPVAPQVIPMP